MLLLYILVSSFNERALHLMHLVKFIYFYLYIQYTPWIIHMEGNIYKGKEHLSTTILYLM